MHDPIFEMPVLPLMSMVTGNRVFCLSKQAILRHPYRVYRWIRKGIVAFPSLALRGEHLVQRLEFWLGPRLEAYSPAAGVTVSGLAPPSPADTGKRQIIQYRTASETLLLNMNLLAVSALLEMMHGPHRIQSTPDSVAVHGDEQLTIDALGAFFASRAGLKTLPLACTFHFSNTHDLHRARFSLGDQGVYSVETD